MNTTEILAVLGRFHPLLVHLPIGIVLGLTVVEILGAIRRQQPAPRLWVSLGTLSILLATTSGWFLHQEPSYGEDWVLEWHERLGIAIAAGSILCFWFHVRNQVQRYRRTLYLLALAILPAGHFGGIMTHGEDFLWEPLESALPEVSFEESPTATASYTDHIRPLIEARCGSCHGARKQKGELRLDTPEWILQGGESGPILEISDPLKSEVIVRLHLPLDDEDHMPPEKKRQLTETQTKLFELWAHSGFPFEDNFEIGQDFTLPEAPEKDFTSSEPEQSPALPEDAIQTLREHLVHVQKLSKSSEGLWVDFAAPAETVNDNLAIKLLSPVLPSVVELSLARTSISDKIVPLLAQMPELQKLDLRGTGITDKGLKELSGSEKLTSINLVGSEITDAILPTLRSFPSLNQVWLWDTQCTPEGILQIRTSLPRLKVDFGESKSPSIPTSPFEPMNSFCPITGEPIDPQYSIVFEEKVIGFCCPNCPKQFWENPEGCLEVLENQ
ncbi:MAG: hypothetical protein CMJ96_02795 [Planctomycetes bacterium]|jgi:uncharacterized membrane protein|nr:hypothetical protein [Planctomycetota bacterium]MDP7245946.1 c-type cytochrome domain-containing protein [Planctomycetota bacterium]|tara:strand:- start:6475 stop:7974 length:1500 start_codon:yes stop_codon:yes gene_type:complete